MCIRDRLLEQAVQHLADVHHTFQENNKIGLLYHLQIVCELNVALHLGYGSKSVSEKASKLSLTRVRTSLNDIGGHGHRGTQNLIAKRGASRSTHAAEDAMHVNRQILRR